MRATVFSFSRGQLKTFSPRQFFRRRPKLEGSTHTPTFPNEEPKTALARSPCAPSGPGSKLAIILGLNLDRPGSSAPDQHNCTSRRRYLGCYLPVFCCYNVRSRSTAVDPKAILVLARNNSMVGGGGYILTIYWLYTYYQAVRVPGTYSVGISLHRHISSNGKKLKRSQHAFICSEWLHSRHGNGRGSQKHYSIVVLTRQSGHLSVAVWICPLFAAIACWLLVRMQWVSRMVFWLSGIPFSLCNNVDI